MSDDDSKTPWTMLEKFGLWGVLAYLVVTNSIATNNANTEFFQGKFVVTLERVAEAMSGTAAELKRKDDALEDAAEAMTKISEQMAVLSERIQRLLTRGYQDLGATTNRPPFVATPVVSATP